MSMERLSKARRKVVGFKQTLKAVNRNQAKVVYLARNAERHVMDPIIQACSGKMVQIIYMESMLVLGKACGIEVGCAAAALIEE